MNLDMTFCSGLRCKRAQSCERFTVNLAKWAQARGIDMSMRRLSMANFSDHNGECDYYIEMQGADNDTDNREA